MTIGPGPAKVVHMQVRFPAQPLTTLLPIICRVDWNAKEIRPGRISRICSYHIGIKRLTGMALKTEEKIIKVTCIESIILEVPNRIGNIGIVIGPEDPDMF